MRIGSIDGFAFSGSLGSSSVASPVVGEGTASDAADYAASASVSQLAEFMRGASPGGDGEQGAHLSRLWGSTTRSDGATVSVGDGLVRDGETVEQGIVVLVERADGTSSSMVLDPGAVHRLTRNDEGGYDVAAGLKGGDGDDLFVGRDLSGLDLEGGGGDNAVFTAGAARLTYTGGGGRDMVFGGGFVNSTLRLGGGKDGLDARSMTGGLVDLGDGGGSIAVDMITDGVLKGGDGDDAVEASIYGSIVDLGEGEDTLRGYSITNSDVSLGDGSDRLLFYELKGSTVRMAATVNKDAQTADLAEPDAEDAVASGQLPDKSDVIQGNSVQSSSIAMGTGNDGVHVYAVEGSTLDTGAGDDRVHACCVWGSNLDQGAGNDSLEAYEIRGAQVDTDGGAQGNDPATHGRDTVKAHHIEGSALTMGWGDDTLRAYAAYDSSITTGGDWAKEQAAAEQQDPTALQGATAPSDKDSVAIAWADTVAIDTGDGDDVVQLDHATAALLGAGRGEDSLSVTDPAARVLTNDALEQTARTTNTTASPWRAIYDSREKHPVWRATGTLDFTI